MNVAPYTLEEIKKLPDPKPHRKFDCTCPLWTDRNGQPVPHEHLDID